MKSFFTSQRFLMVYSGVLTAVFSVTVLCAFDGAARKATFGEIDAQRINIVEPDGTLRMVISDQARFPGIIVKNKEVYAHKDRVAAGMVFYNQEGTENGGLIFGGSKSPDGTVSSYGHLSFDRYLQDQVLTEDATEDGASRQVAIDFIDRPDWPITDLVALPQSQWKDFVTSHPMPHQRIHLGRNADKSASLVLKDQDGRPRVVIEVAADGTPVLKLLDAQGKVVSQLPPAPDAKPSGSE